MWIIGSLLMVFVLRDQIISWNSNPIIRSTVYLNLDEIDFPAVTICPLFSTPLKPEERLMSGIIDNGEKIRSFRNDLSKILLKTYMQYDFNATTQAYIESYSKQYSDWFFKHCINGPAEPHAEYCHLYFTLLHFSYDQNLTMSQTYEQIFETLKGEEDINLGLQKWVSKASSNKLLDERMILKNGSIDWVIMENLAYFIKVPSITNDTLKLPVNRGRILASIVAHDKEDIKKRFEKFFPTPFDSQRIPLHRFAILFSSKEFDELGFWQHVTTRTFDTCFHELLDKTNVLFEQPICQNKTILREIPECQMYCSWHESMFNSSGLDRKLFLTIMKLALPERKAELGKFSKEEWNLARNLFGEPYTQEPNQMYTSTFLPLFCKLSKKDHWLGDKVTTFSARFCSQFYVVPSDEGLCYSMNHDLHNQLNFTKDFLEVFDGNTEAVEKIPGKRSMAEATFVINTNTFSRVQSERSLKTRNEDRKLIKVHIHSGKHIPLLSTELNHEELDHVLLESGFEFTFKLSPYGQIVTERFQEHEKHLARKDCMSQTDLNINETSFKKYRKSNCIYACKMKIASDYCKCLPWEFSAIDSKVFFKNEECNVFGRSCFFEQMSNYSLTEDKNCTYCGNDCVFMEYPKEFISKAPLVTGDDYGRFSKYLLINDSNMCREENKEFCEYARDLQHILDPETWIEKVGWNSISLQDKDAYLNKIRDLIIINIKFGSNVVQVDQLDVKYTTLDRIANLGGTIGVAEQITGASLLTLIHLFVLFIRLVFHCLNTNSCKNTIAKEKSQY